VTISVIQKYFEDVVPTFPMHHLCHIAENLWNFLMTKLKCLILLKSIKQFK